MSFLFNDCVPKLLNETLKIISSSLSLASLAFIHLLYQSLCT